MKILFIIGLYFFFFSSQSYAALYINEFSSVSSSDWIEIYNSDSGSVDLGNYIIRDSSGSNKLDLTGNIGGNSFMTFDWDNKLNNDGDSIRLLLESDESTIDSIVYGNSVAVSAPTGDQTGGRNPDGGGTWVLFSSASKGSSNNSSTVVPTPTPTPTNTPTPTPTPTNTPTPTPTPTNTPTPTPKGTTPTPTAAPKSKVTPTPQTMVAQNTNASGQNPPQQEVKGADIAMGGNLDDLEAPKESGYNWWRLLIVMGAVIVTGTCGVFLYNNHIKERSEELNSAT